MTNLITIRDSILVHAPIERCFALSTRLEIVHRELGFDGTPSTGHVSLHSHVLWSGWMFGLHHEHLTFVPQFDPPHFFRDQMERGRFQHFHHDHHLREVPEGTELNDEIVFSLPFWWGGAFAAKYILKPKIAALLRTRLQLIKCIAESKDEWQQYVSSELGGHSI